MNNYLKELADICEIQKKLTMHEGIPYQTLGFIILHKYESVRLVDKTG
jgi:predicted DNA binding CopG/RHH family protein